MKAPKSLVVDTAKTLRSEISALESNLQYTLLPCEKAAIQPSIDRCKELAEMLVATARAS